MITCPICEQHMTPVIPKSAPEKGEHYCPDCRKSTPMKDLGEVQYYQAFLKGDGR